MILRVPIERRGLAVVGLRPEVARVVQGAAELQRHVVVVLIRRRGAAQAVGGHARELLWLRDRLRRAHGEVQPDRQIVMPMLACVTAGFTAPGVHRGSGREYTPTP